MTKDYLNSNSGRSSSQVGSGRGQVAGGQGAFLVHGIALLRCTPEGHPVRRQGKICLAGGDVTHVDTLNTPLNRTIHKIEGNICRVWEILVRD